MNSTDLLNLFRSDVRDNAEPYLWSDSEVFQYLDLAQEMFCRETGGIPDATSDVTRVDLVAGESFAAVSPRILKIRAASRAEDARQLRLLNYEDLELGEPVDDYGIRVGNMRTNRVGPVRAIVLGMEQNKIRLIDIPDEDQTIELLVDRMPLVEITGLDQQLEIDTAHHYYLLHWMKHLAHNKQDAETFDRGRSDMFRGEFLAYCDRVKEEKGRLRHKYRTVAYGGY